MARNKSLLRRSILFPPESGGLAQSGPSSSGAQPHASCRVQSEGWRRQVDDRLQPGRDQRQPRAAHAAARSRCTGQQHPLPARRRSGCAPAGSGGLLRPDAALHGEPERCRGLRRAHALRASASDALQPGGWRSCRASWSRATRSTSCATRSTSWPATTTASTSTRRPALNFYTRSALIASERCLIPFDCDDFCAPRASTRCWRTCASCRPTTTAA